MRGEHAGQGARDVTRPYATPARSDAGANECERIAQARLPILTKLRERLVATATARQWQLRYA